jgi:hypothetical protein
LKIKKAHEKKREKTLNLIALFKIHKVFLKKTIRLWFLLDEEKSRKNQFF